MTPEQNVVNIRSELMELYAVMQEALTAYVFHSQNENTAHLEKVQGLLHYQNKATECFNGAENFVGNSELLGARESPHWAQGYAEDCYALLESMPQHFDLLRVEFEKLGLSPTASCEPGSTAFANMQRIVSLYLPDKKSELCKTFKENKLPVYGFKNKAKDIMNSDKKWAFAFGIIFISIILLIALFVSEPTHFQYKVFQTVLALAGAGIGARLPGFIEVKFKSWLRAGGAVAIFVLVYFLNPAAMVV
jgi:hypothetical protein